MGVREICDKCGKLFNVDFGSCEAHCKRKRICVICGKETNDFAGDPGQWPVYISIPWRPCEPGKCFDYHRDCLYQEMLAREKRLQKLEKIRERFNMTRSLFKEDLNDDEES